MNCSNCSASISVDALTCPYCGTETPNAPKARALKEQQERHAAQLAAVDASKARQKDLIALQASAKNSFYASIIGVVCCIPVGSVVGLVLAFRARGVAKRLQTAVPWQAMAAIILGVFWIGFFSLAMVMGAIGEREKAARVAAIRETTKDAVLKPELDDATACSLVEIALLEGYAGGKGGNLGLFRCEGKLEQTGEKALLHDLEFARSSNDKPRRVDACLSKGKKWKVDAIGRGEGCGAKADGGTSLEDD